MIYSASRRTDLPAFYPDFLVGKIQRSRKLDGVVYWTKDIRNFIRHFGLRAAVTSYPTIIQYTVTGLAGSEWEPGVPQFSSQLEALAELVQLLPRGAVRWRFDPVIADSSVLQRFSDIYKLMEEAGAGLEAVTVSFPDIYPKVAQRLQQRGLNFPELQLEQKFDLLHEFYRISGLEIWLCCEEELLEDNPGYLRRGACVSGELFRDLYNIAVDMRKDQGQRVNCGCTRSTDIGSYDLICGHECLYCYASK